MINSQEYNNHHQQWQKIGGGFTLETDDSSELGIDKEDTELLLLLVFGNTVAELLLPDSSADKYLYCTSLDLSMAFGLNG